MDTLNARTSTNDFACSQISGTTLDAANLQRIQVATIGFHEQPLNLIPELETAWNATLRILIRYECAGVGTVFLFAKDENFAYLMTNRHVIMGGVGRRDPPHATSCLRGAYLRVGAVELNPLMEATQHFDASADLAIIRVHLNSPGGEYFRRLDPIRLPTECFAATAGSQNQTEQQDLFSIGYPSVSLLGQSLEDNNRRRWSSGQRIFHLDENVLSDMRDYSARNHFRVEDFIFGQVYSLRGNSGGPVLDRQGHFVGVVGASRGPRPVPGVGFQPERWDNPEDQDFVGIIRCERVLQFLRSHPLSDSR